MYIMRSTNHEIVTETSTLTRETKHNKDTDFVLARIAFDGCCRTGKGEQLGSLNSYFTSRGVPTMVLKGDGTRMGAGQAWHDLGSRYWTHRYDYHSGMHTPKSEWDVDAYTLARENRVWEQAIADIGRISRSCFAAVIYDRSIVSRATLALQRELSEGRTVDGKLSPEQMWPAHLQIPGEEITYEETQPDILFNLTAPQSVLGGRVSQDDRDAAFRYRAIFEYYDDFLAAINALPEGTRTKIVDLDGEAPIKELNKEVLQHLSAYYPDVKQLENVEEKYPEYSAKK
jgi:thymidylate kinase